MTVNKELEENSKGTQHIEDSHGLPVPSYDLPQWFGSYGCQRYSRTNPLYKSTSMEYGWFPPNTHTAPLTYHPARRAFTEHLHFCGMYRNTSLNTAMDPKPWGE